MEITEQDFRCALVFNTDTILAVSSGMENGKILVFGWEELTSRYVTVGT
jgi:hypothetical protein